MRMIRSRTMAGGTVGEHASADTVRDLLNHRNTMITRKLWLTGCSCGLYNPAVSRTLGSRVTIMVKADLVEIIARQAGITKVQAEVAVDSIIGALKGGLARGERIELRGFGVFEVKPRKRGVGRNPRTGEVVEIPPGKTTRFRPGKALGNLTER